MSEQGNDSRAFDRLIHQPARLTILTVLAAGRAADFQFLQSLTGVAQGNLSNHLRKLEDAGLVTIEKGYRGRRPHTQVAITAEGRASLQQHWRRLEDLWTTTVPVPPDLSAATMAVK